jgi:hypothetical protein
MCAASENLPGDESASRWGLSVGAERLWGFEGHTLGDVVSAGRSSGTGILIAKITKAFLFFGNEHAIFHPIHHPLSGYISVVHATPTGATRNVCNAIGRVGSRYFRASARPTSRSHDWRGPVPVGQGRVLLHQK